MQSTICLQLVLLCVVQITYGSPSDLEVENCGVGVRLPDSPDRIIGGSDVEQGEYPFIVSIRKEGNRGFRHWCGGSILNENWILTAAHCFDSSRLPSKFEVLAGLHRLSEEDDETVRSYKISKIVISSKYNKRTFLYDIALLKTSTPIDIQGSDGYINGVCLPKTKRDPTGFINIIGWGITKEDGKYPDTLQRITVPLIDRKTCELPYPWTVFDTTICAGKPGQDACKGDSGGPVFKVDKNDRAILYGVVSHSVGCARKGYPGVHQKVSMYQDWMEDVILNNVNN